MTDLALALAVVASPALDGGRGAMAGETVARAAFADVRSPRDAALAVQAVENGHAPTFVE